MREHSRGAACAKALGQEGAGYAGGARGRPVWPDSEELRLGRGRALEGVPIEFLIHFLGRHSSHVASVFPQLSIVTHRKGKAGFRPARPCCQLARYRFGPRSPRPKTQLSLPPEAVEKKREEGESPLRPLLCMQSEGHMEINVCSSDNTDVLGVLIKCRRLLNTLLLRAHLRGPVLLFISNSDELSQFRSCASAEPWSAEGWRLRRMEKINMKCQARGQIELVFPAGRGWGAAATAEQRERGTEEGRHFARVRKMKFTHALIRLEG